jgi:hypothetical protein
LKFISVSKKTVCGASHQIILLKLLSISKDLYCLKKVVCRKKGIILRIAYRVVHDEFIQKRFLRRGERGELQAALTFLNNAEECLVAYLEVSNIFNRDTGHEEIAVDKDIYFLSLSQPVLLIHVTYCHPAFADIHNPCDL